MTDAELKELMAKAQAVYNGMTPEQKAEHDYAQRRSFVRGMCPDDQDFTRWCSIVDRLLPPLR